MQAGIGAGKSVLVEVVEGAQPLALGIGLIVVFDVLGLDID